MAGNVVSNVKKYYGGQVPVPGQGDSDGKVKVLVEMTTTMEIEGVQTDVDLLYDSDDLTTPVTPQKLGQWTDENYLIVFKTKDADGKVRGFILYALETEHTSTDTLVNNATFVAFKGLEIDPGASAFVFTMVEDSSTLSRYLKDEVGEVTVKFNLSSVEPGEQSGYLSDLIGTDSPYMSFQIVRDGDYVYLNLNTDNLDDELEDIEERLDVIEGILDELPSDEHGYFNSSLVTTPGDGTTTSLVIDNFRISAGRSVHGDNIEFVQTHQEGGVDFGEVYLNPGTYILNVHYTLQWVGNPRGTFLPLVANVGEQPFDFSYEHEDILRSTRIMTRTTRGKFGLNFPFDADTPPMGIWVKYLEIAQIASYNHPAVTHDSTLAGSGQIGDPLRVTPDAFGKVKDIPTSISQFRNGDVIPVDGPNGPAKMEADKLLKLTAQNSLADNVAPAFDPTRTSENPYKSGESVAYEDKIYVFINDHYGVWTGTDVVRSYVNDCGGIDDGGIRNSGNTDKVHTRVMSFCPQKPFILKITKPPKTAGGYYKVGVQLTADASAIGQYSRNGSYSYIISKVSEEGFVYKENVVDSLAQYPTAKGIAFEIKEYTANGQVVPNRASDYVGFSISLTQPEGVPQLFLNGGMGNTANPYKVHTAVFPLEYDVRTYMVRLQKAVKAPGNYFKIGYTLTNSPSDIGRDVSLIIIGGTGYGNHEAVARGIRLDSILDLSSNAAVGIGFEIIELDSAGHEVVNRESDFYGAEIDLIPVKDSDKTADSYDYGAVNAIARYSVAYTGSRDFSALIVTDSHDDNSSVTRAADCVKGSGILSSLIHCGDYVGSYVYYGQSSTEWAGTVNRSSKPLFFVQGNHEKGTFSNIATTPTDETLYNLFIKPIVDKGYLNNGEYEVNKCYYYHDFTSLKARLIVLDEYRAPTDYLETYWQAITYDDTLSDVADNTDYAIGDKVNVPGFTANSFQAVQAVNTGAYYSGRHPCYRCRRGYRYIDQIEAEWFLDTLYDTPSDYIVVVAMHNPFSDVAFPDKTKKFCQKINIPDGLIGASWSQNYMATDFIADVLHSFKNGLSYSGTVSTKQDSEAAYIQDYTVSKDFSQRGTGKLGIIIGGHVHRDVVWKHPTYTYMYQVTPMCSITASSDNNRYADIRLQSDASLNGYSDSLTVFSVADDRIALAKLGCKYTTDALVRDIEVL